MIIVQLKGGLGNQLFQYAAGYALARNKNVELKVDCSELGKDATLGTFRNFELQKFTCNPIVASQTEVDFFLQKPFLKKYFQKILPGYLRDVYKEKYFSFDLNFLKTSNHIYLKGYRQSEKYFVQYKQDISQIFQIRKELILSVEDLKQSISTQNSVSIHIRRGDYANNKIAFKTHGLLDEAYYNSAINLLKNKVNQIHFFVFSDDVNWVKSNIQLSNSITFITQNESASSITDFYLMQHCKHNIIANSTFSWWAAYLNPNPHKIVIAPKKWFNNAPYNTKDLFPPDWILM